MDTIQKALEKQAKGQPDQEKDTQVSAGGVVSEPAATNEIQPDLVVPVADAINEQHGSNAIGGTDLEVDVERLTSMGFIVPDDSRNRLVEQYKHIKRPLLQKARKPSQANQPNNIIMVTSAFSGEGKTHTALNLGLSIALERDCRVLLVDADVVKPSMSSILQAEGKPGLVDFLTNDVPDISATLLSTNIPNFRFLPAGKKHHLTHELLASNVMANLCEELSSRYPDRVIILDSPPMLATSEARVLAQLAGQVVLVVEQDKTAQSSVHEALERVEKERVAGLVLNKASASHKSYYGYYYGD